MLNLLKCEFYKLKRSKIFWIIAILFVIEGIVGIALSPALRHDSGKKAMFAMFGGEEFLGQIIFIGIFTVFITNEFKTGYIKNLISYGHKRKDIVLSKSIVFSVGIILTSLVLPITVIAINTVMNGYGEVFDFKAFTFVLRIIFVMMFSYISLASIAILISFISRNIIVPIGILYFLDIANRMISAISLRSNDIGYLYNKTIFCIPNIAISSNPSITQIIQVILHALAVSALSIILSIHIFNKKDLH